MTGARQVASTENAHIARENKDIVKQDVRKAPREHGGHGKPRPAVTAGKADENVIEEKGGCAEQEHAQVSAGIRKGGCIRTEQMRDRIAPKAAGQHKSECEHRSHAKAVGEGHAAGFSTAPVEDKVHCPAAPEHQSAAVDEAVDRNGQIQGGQSGFAECTGNEPCIGKNIAGQPEHAKHAERHIADEFAEMFWFHEVPPVAKKRRSLHLQGPNDAVSGAFPLPGGREMPNVIYYI